jgi:hypothetical protein
MNRPQICIDCGGKLRYVGCKDLLSDEGAIEILKGELTTPEDQGSC